MVAGQTPVTSSQIREAVRRIVERFRPKRVVLFGSYAYGQPTESSDVDLLVVLPSLPPPHERRTASTGLGRGLPVPLQLVFMGEEEFVETRGVVGGIAYPAHKWGEVLYEANA